MAIDYTQVLSSEAVIAEIESLLDWHSRLLRRAFYAETRSTPVETWPTTIVLAQCQQLAEKGALDKAAVESLAKLYKTLYESARDCGGEQPPTLEQYDALTQNLEAYIACFCRLRGERPQEGGGETDPLTRLLSGAGIAAHLKREQERFDRKGTPFSVASIIIDNLPGLQKQHSAKGMETLYAYVAQSITKTVRSFDDSFQMWQGEFAIILKHVSFLDACAVMDRLRRNIAKVPVTLDSGEAVSLTASLGVSESLQRIQADRVLANARAAMQKSVETGGNRISEYKEKSAFETFVRGNKETPS